MKTMKTRHTTATLTPQRAAKRVVLSGNFGLAVKAADQFRKLGWDVRTVAPHDLCAASAADPHAVVLAEDAGAESGYLACAKLLLSAPDLKVVLVAPERTRRRERFAEFVGAEFVAETDGVNGLVNAVA